MDAGPRRAAECGIRDRLPPTRLGPAGRATGPEEDGRSPRRHPLIRPSTRLSVIPEGRTRTEGPILGSGGRVGAAVVVDILQSISQVGADRCLRMGSHRFDVPRLYALG